MILLDANILLRICNSQDPLCRHTLTFVFARRKADTLVIVPQSLYEFWAVATRDTASNGLGMDPARASRWIGYFSRLFRLRHDPQQIYAAWADLVAQYRISGFRAHDARYVAAMDLHSITALMTFNVKHFSIFPISIIDPTPT